MLNTALRAISGHRIGETGGEVGLAGTGTGNEGAAGKTVVNVGLWFAGGDGRRYAAGCRSYGASAGVARGTGAPHVRTDGAVAAAGCCHPTRHSWTTGSPTAGGRWGGTSRMVGT